MKTTNGKVGKNPQKSLEASELRYRRLFEAAQDGILILDAKTGMIEDVNPFLINMLGYSREEFVKKKLWDVGAFQDVKASKEAFDILQDKEYIRYENLPLKTKDGRLIQVEFVSNVYVAGDEKVIQCNIRDITEHKRIVAVLQANERKYYDLLAMSPDGIFIIDLKGRILTVNKAMCDELGFSEEEFLAMKMWDLIPKKYLNEYKGRLTKMLAGEVFEGALEYEIRGKDGRNHYVEIFSTPHYDETDIVGFQGIARDITARKQTEEALRESEEQLVRAQAVAKVGSWETDLSNLNVIWSEETYRILEIDPKSYKASHSGFLAFVHPEDRARVDAAFLGSFDTHTPNTIEHRIVTPGGIEKFIEERWQIIRNVQGQPMRAVGTFQDITLRKQAEEQVRSSRGFLQSVQNALSAHIAILDQAGIIVQVNSAWRDFGAQNGLKHPDHCIGMNYLEVCDTATGENAEESALLANAIREVLSGGQDEVSVEYPCHAPHKKRWFVARVTSFINDQKRWIVVAHENITERKLAEEKAQRQIEHLIALGSIDRMITSNFDLKLTLSEILTQVMAELKVDAADILILDTGSQILEFGAEHGFRTNIIHNAQVRLGEGYAGRVAMERKTVQVKALDEDADVLFLNDILKDEGFSNYFGVPLITKGQVRGVLEIYHRSMLNPDNEWFEFLNTLAAQAAIAAENAMLFDSLQRSNLELSLAYDATIEGWSRALDLRDKETEGHSLRVTQMTVELARAFGLHEEELVQVRWGSLLHDIGKMGVPDGILLKPGELTEAEWVAMKKHPVFAYEMLSPIRYLRQALDIPYCHHEKWDGSGYPRRLKGEQIPLPARIFAVVDVWDALTSDRPYRAAWTKEEAIAYIRASTGTHFDPQVVDMFMQTTQ